MFISVVVVIVILWVIAGVLYRERLFHKAAIERAKEFNRFVEAMEQEFGEYEVSIAAKKHEVPLFSEEYVKKSRLASRVMW